LGTSNSNINEQVYPPNIPDVEPRLGRDDVYPPVPPTQNGPSTLDIVYGRMGSGQLPAGNPIGRVYPKTAEDFVVEKILAQKDLTLGNMKPIDKYNISLGDFNPPDSDFEM
jgi:hypothetical protein